MIADPDAGGPSPQLIVIDIGNTRTALGSWADGEVSRVSRVPTEDAEAFAAALASLGAFFVGGRAPAGAIGSVVPKALARAVEQIGTALHLEAGVVGQSLPLPMEVDVAAPQAVGVDRVCCAAAAFERIQSACMVVDFGTAITADVVGDDGRFLGGAILPGARLQSRALHAYTAKLPEVEIVFPREPIGRDTVTAIQTGVCRGIAGAMRGIVEGIATHLGKWPQVVGTGGDLDLFLPHCDFLDSAVANLSLMGIGLAWAKGREQRRSDPGAPGT